MDDYMLCREVHRGARDKGRRSSGGPDLGSSPTGRVAGAETRPRLFAPPNTCNAGILLHDLEMLEAVSGDYRDFPIIFVAQCSPLCQRRVSRFPQAEIR